jgi:hypothetical protein
VGVVAATEWVCLRCDWTGGGDGTACPKCGVSLYRRSEPTTARAEPTTARAEPTTPRDVVAAARAGPPAAAAHRVRSSPIEESPVGTGSPPARPATRTGERWVVIVLALVVTAGVGGGFLRLTTPEPQAVLSGPEKEQETPAPQETPPSDGGVVVQPEPPVGGKPERSARYIAKAAAICAAVDLRFSAVVRGLTSIKERAEWDEAAVRFSERSLERLRALPLPRSERARFTAYYALLGQQTLFLRRAATAASAGHTARARRLGMARVHVTHLKDGFVPELESCPVGLPA